jgi:superfamily II DNA/RNA helicase
MVSATPIQEASLNFLYKGYSLSLHSATGSGKTLAFLLPVLLRLSDQAIVTNSRVLVLAPSRELAAQIVSEAQLLLAPGAGLVRLVCNGERSVATIASLMEASVIVATPVELAEALAEDKELREWLPTSISTLILDELDVLMPSRKFSGKRIVFMDEGMHPAEGIVKLIARRNSREDLQVIAASASLDQSTQRKLTRLLRASPALKASSVPLPVCRAAEPGATVALSAPTTDDDGNDRVKGSRTTLVPSVIKHFTVSMDNRDLKDPLKLVRAAAKKLGTEGVGMVVLCSSLPLKVRVVTRELCEMGLDASALSDALWPDSTRSLKGRTRSRRMLKPSSSAVSTTEAAADADELALERAPDGPQIDHAGGEAAGGEAAGAAARNEAAPTVVPGSSPTALDRRASFCDSLALPVDAGAKLPMRLVVIDQAKARGLHLDSVAAVFVLGGAANADTYLHLAGRTGRWPRVEGTVVTIAPDAELRRLASWGNELGGVTFSKLEI